MRLFLDASVLLAAAGSATGSLRAVFTYAPSQGWTLVTSTYAAAEVLKNLPKLHQGSAADWDSLRAKINLVPDIFSASVPVVIAASKDRPILLTAPAYADKLLTLDRKDFGSLLGGDFYGLQVLLPYEFLRLERAADRLQI